MDEQRGGFGPTRTMQHSGWIVVTGGDMYRWGFLLRACALELVRLGFPIGIYEDKVVVSPLMFEACQVYFNRNNCYADLTLSEYLIKLGLNEHSD